MGYFTELISLHNPQQGYISFLCHFFHFQPATHHKQGPEEATASSPYSTMPTVSSAIYLKKKKKKTFLDRYIFCVRGELASYTVMQVIKKQKTNS